MQYDHTFIITSCINTSTGKISPNDRLKQTVETINSIKNKVSNCYIILIDNSHMNEMMGMALSQMVNFYLNVYDRQFLRSIPNKFNINGIKGIGEAYMMQVALDHAKQIECKRIFKISGRYKLTDSFDIKEYDHEKFIGKYAFQFMQDCNFGHNQCNCRMWSMCSSLVNDCRDKLKNALIMTMRDMMIIEDSIYKNFLPDIVGKTHLHVEGYLAELNMRVEE